MISMILACIASHTGFSIENPWLAILWLLPFFRSLLALPWMCNVSLDMCAYGLRNPAAGSAEFWKKPTRCVASSLHFGILEKKCDGSHVHGDLGRRHMIVLPNGSRKSKIEVAGAYTASFCKRLVTAARAAVNDAAWFEERDFGPAQL